MGSGGESRSRHTPVWSTDYQQRHHGNSVGKAKFLQFYMVLKQFDIRVFKNELSPLPHIILKNSFKVDYRPKHTNSNYKTSKREQRQKLFITRQKAKFS